MSTTMSLNELEQRLITLRDQFPHSLEVIDICNQIAEHRDVDTQRTLALSQEAYELAQSANDTPRLTRSLANMCLAYSLQAQVEKAILYANEALILLELSPDPHLEAHVYLSIAQSNQLMGQYAASLSYGNKAIRLYQQVGDRDGTAKILNTIAVDYAFTGQPDTAITTFRQAFEIYQTIHDIRNQSVMLNNIAYAYLEQNKIEQAYATIRESVQLQRTPLSLDTMSEILLLMGDIDAAKQCVQEAQKLNRSDDGVVQIQDLEVSLIRTLARINQQCGAFDSASEYYKEALSLSKVHNLKQQQTQTLRHIISLYEEYDDTEQALSYFKHLYKLEKELFNEESNQKIRNLQVMHETETAQREAAIFQQENRKLEQTITVLEQTKLELQTALNEVEQRAEEQQRLLAENEHQRRTISELSLPVLPLTDTILIMPLIGELDSNRLQQLQERALSAIHQTSATHVVLDITGVPIIDTQIAQGIITAVQATRLLGTEVILVGIRPEVAQAIVSLGLDLHGVQTTTNLQAALSALKLFNWV